MESKCNIGRICRPKRPIVNRFVVVVEFRSFTRRGRLPNEAFQAYTIVSNTLTTAITLLYSRPERPTESSIAIEDE